MQCVCCNLLLIKASFASLHTKIYSFQNSEYLLYLLVFILYNEVFMSFILYGDWQNHFSSLETVIIYFPFSNCLVFPMFLVFQK